MKSIFIDGKDIREDELFINDIFKLSKSEFLKSYGYITEEEYQATIDKMWEELSDIPVNNTGEKIDTDFYYWKKGTLKEDIWHWFDERVTGGIGNRYFN